MTKRERLYHYMFFDGIKIRIIKRLKAESVMEWIMPIRSIIYPSDSKIKIESLEEVNKRYE